MCLRKVSVYIVVVLIASWGEACSVNLCLLEVSGIVCQSSSVVLIQHVTCLRKGHTCGAHAFSDVIEACAGRLGCTGKRIDKLKTKYCTIHTPEEHSRGLLSVLFVNYACIRYDSIEKSCNHDGQIMDISEPYIWSKGYPDMAEAKSLCKWRIRPGVKNKVEIRTIDYRHRSKSKAFVNIRETKYKGYGYRLNKSTAMGKPLTLKGDIEIVMFTVGASTKHRIWIQYRVIKESEKEPLTITNQTQCRVSYTKQSQTTPVSLTVPSTIFTVHIHQSPTNQPFNQTLHDIHRTSTKAVMITVSLCLCLPLVIAAYLLWKHRTNFHKCFYKRRRHKKLTLQHRQRGGAMVNSVSCPSPVPSNCTQLTECDLNTVLDPSDYAVLNSVRQSIDFSKYVISKNKYDNPEISWSDEGSPELPVC